LAGDEYYQIQTKISDRSFSELYMQRISKQKGVAEIVPQALYVRRTKVGWGQTLLGSDRAAFHIKCKSLRGDCIVDTYKAKKPIVQDMRIAAAGFSQGVVGMKTGEKRILYIHPTIGANQFHINQTAAPLIVEAELVQIVN
jgi:peptidylprolyl isomerase